ncbi:hypothetical protein Gotur_014225 [Gossypium turneri]
MKERVKTRRFRLSPIKGQIWLFTCLIREVVHWKLVLLGINNEDSVDVVNKGYYNENLSQQLKIDDRRLNSCWSFQMSSGILVQANEELTVI